MARRYCECCAKQIVKGQGSDSCVAPAEYAVRLVNGWCCGDCAKDLNDNGTFPDEGDAGNMGEM